MTFRNIAQVTPDDNDPPWFKKKKKKNLAYKMFINSGRVL